MDGRNFFILFIPQFKIKKIYTIFIFKQRSDLLFVITVISKVVKCENCAAKYVEILMLQKTP